MAFPAFRIEGPKALPASEGLVFAPGSPLADTQRACARIAQSDATVLLSGETGTGKEILARFIHASSPRAGRPFVPVNCGAIPENLIESELFGYVRGAFTGALAPRRGRVAMAEGGTLFLDEVGELPLGLQVKLLRLLQERSYEAVGSSESVTADFRLVAATNRDLGGEVRAGRFRKDLYYRLFVCPINLPPLRERPGDVAAIFQHFWQARGEDRPVHADVLQRLALYDWPGNVRELENLVERLSVCCESQVINLADLPLECLGGPPEEGAHERSARPRGHELASLLAAPALEVRKLDEGGFGARAAPAVYARPALVTPAPASPPAANHVHEALARFVAPASGLPFALPVDLPTMLRTLENTYIDAALAQTGSNKKEAAKLLGMGRTTLVEKLRRRAADAARTDGDPPVAEDEPRDGHGPS
jgi:sigma-54 specific flagellar transcriptional regulator A